MLQQGYEDIYFGETEELSDLLDKMIMPHLNFNDQQNVKAALLEYRKRCRKINESLNWDEERRIHCTAAHIYDNVNDNEEQVCSTRLGYSKYSYLASFSACPNP